MIKKKVKFEDFNGNEVEEVFHFNLNQTELTELELSYEGGFSNHARGLVEKKDTRGLISFYKHLLIKSYGVVSDDGRKFYKTEEYAKDFISSPAFDEIFLELLSDENASREFFIGILPSKHAAEVRKRMDNMTDEDIESFLETGEIKEEVKPEIFQTNNQTE